MNFSRFRFRSLLPSLLAYGLGLGLVYVNWFLVDPFHLRALPALPRYAIVLAAGLLVGGLLALAWQTLPLWRPSLQDWRIAAGLAGLAALLFLVLDLSPAPNRFSISTLRVQTGSQPVQVVVNSIQAGGKKVDLGICSKKGNWEDYEGILVALPGQDNALSCLLTVPPGSEVSVDFQTTQPAVRVTLQLGRQVVAADLSAASGARQVAARLAAPATLAPALILPLRAVDGVLCTLLVLALAQTGAWKLRPFLQRPAQAIGADVLNAIFSWFEETTPRFQQLVLVVAVLSTLLTGYLLVQPLVAGRRAAVRAAGGQNPPNVIFIVVDALAAQDMSLYGYSLPTTPNLERITKNWTVYTHAQSPQTCTVSSLPAFSTGRNPYVNNFPLYGEKAAQSPQWLSLPQTLKQNGYQTWWLGYNSPGYYHLGSGFENSACRPGSQPHTSLIRSWFEPRGVVKAGFPFIPYTLEQLDTVGYGHEDFNRCEEIDGLASILQNQEASSPFYIYYHYRGVHGLPYPSGSFLGAFLPIEAGMISFDAQHSVYGHYDSAKQPQVDELRLRYDEAIADQDARLGRFLDDLKQQSWYDSTMIVITADHGQSFNNDYSSHCTWLISQAEANVPLLIKYPGQTQGKRVERLVSTLDVTPTILDVTGFQLPSSLFDGRSLLQEPASGADKRIVFTRRISFLSVLPEDLAATDGDYRLVMRKQTYYLYDYRNDPLEKNNLIADQRYAALPAVQALKDAMQSYLQRSRMLLQGQDFTNSLP